MEYTTEVFSSVIVEGFLGGSLKNEKIDGENVAQHLLKLVYDVHSQIKDPLTWILGPWILDYGFRKSDKIINKRI